MGLSDERARFIREEFACFVRIGGSPGLREQVERALEDSDGTAAVIRIEERDGDGALAEVWVIESDGGQVARLGRFLGRFTVDEVRRMESLLAR
jgi:hypothetical protein